MGENQAAREDRGLGAQMGDYGGGDARESYVIFGSVLAAVIARPEHGRARYSSLPKSILLILRHLLALFRQFPQESLLPQLKLSRQRYSSVYGLIFR